MGHNPYRHDIRKTLANPDDSHGLSRMDCHSAVGGGWESSRRRLGAHTMAAQQKFRDWGARSARRVERFSKRLVSM